MCSVCQISAEWFDFGGVAAEVAFPPVPSRPSDLAGRPVAAGTDPSFTFTC